MWCNVVQCGTMWHNVAQCGAMWHDVAQCHAMWCNVGLSEFLLSFLLRLFEQERFSEISPTFLLKNLGLYFFCFLLKKCFLKLKLWPEAFLPVPSPSYCLKFKQWLASTSNPTTVVVVENKMVTALNILNPGLFVEITVGRMDTRSHILPRPAV